MLSKDNVLGVLNLLCLRRHIMLIDKRSYPYK
jgi:hypothetical protein